MEPRIQQQELSFRRAVAADADELTLLVNYAYRGNFDGWSTEAHLVKGNRIETDGLLSLIAAENSVILVCEQAGEIISSAHLEKSDEGAYFGLFVVHPKLQAQGLGKIFLQAAEDFAQREWGVSRMWMTVITLRHELLAYYERRGYRRTGQVKPFPADAGSSKPVVDGVELEVLEKFLTQVD